MDLVEQIIATEQYAAFEENYTKIVKGVNVKRSVARLLEMHGVRKIRSLTTDEMMANARDELVDANMQNQQLRSEAAEIKLKLFVAQSDLSELNDRFWKWVTTAYSAELLAKKLQSSEKGWNFVATIIDYSVTKLNKLNSAIAIADQIIQDLDKCHFSLKAIQETFATLAQERYHQ